jgi:hypothetical protein
MKNKNEDIKNEIFKKLQDPKFYADEEPIHTDEFKKYVDLDGHDDLSASREIRY